MISVSRRNPSRRRQVCRCFVELAVMVTMRASRARTIAAGRCTSVTPTAHQAALSRSAWFILQSSSFSIFVAARMTSIMPSFDMCVKASEVTHPREVMDERHSHSAVTSSPRPGGCQACEPGRRDPRVEFFSLRAGERPLVDLDFVFGPHCGNVVPPEVAGAEATSPPTIQPMLSWAATSDG